MKFQLPLLLALATSLSAVPSDINYQGRLTDANGDAVTGNVTMGVKMYDAQSGGNEIYSEDVGTVTLDENGVYSFQFGASGNSTVTKTETIVTSDGTSTDFTGTFTSTPIEGTISVTDETYSWNDVDGNPGEQATAYIIIINGFVIFADIENGGSGYDDDNPPLVTITGDGSGATATATVENGVITGIAITGSGLNYTEGDIAISPPPAPFTVDKVDGDLEVGYTVAPAVRAGVVATYKTLEPSIIGALSEASSHWMELTVDGTTQNPRERILSVPFAQVAGVSGISSNQNGNKGEYFFSDGSVSISAEECIEISQIFSDSGYDDIFIDVTGKGITRSTEFAKLQLPFFIPGPATVEAKDDYGNGSNFTYKIFENTGEYIFSDGPVVINAGECIEISQLFSEMSPGNARIRVEGKGITSTNSLQLPFYVPGPVTVVGDHANGYNTNFTYRILNSDGSIKKKIDSDGDGVRNHLDRFPYDSAETADTDGDSVGDNADAFPNDPFKTTNLIASYPFNGNALDQTNNNYNGTVYGATLAQDRFGNANSAYSFDGIDDYIDFGDPDEVFDFGNNDFSISLWVKSNGDQSGKYIISKYDGNGEPNSFGLGTHSNSQVYVWSSSNAHGNSQSAYLNDSYYLNDGAWHHLVLVFSNDYMNLYVDGDLRDDIYLGASRSNGGIINNDASLVVGRITKGQNFGGLIDDIKLYNEALSNNQISDLFEIVQIDTDEDGVPDNTDIFPNDSVSDNLNFVLNGSGGFTISDCKTTAIGRVNIPKLYEGIPVTEIGAYAFDGCALITQVIVPDGLTEVRDQAFRNCIGLLSVYMPDSVILFGNGIFSGCTSLSDVRLSNNMPKITDTMFQYTAITTIDIPSSVTKIDRVAFDLCESLISIVIPSSVTTFGETVFNRCANLEEITFEGNAPSIIPAGIASHWANTSNQPRLFNIGYNAHQMFPDLYLPDDFIIKYNSDNSGFTEEWFNSVLRNYNSSKSIDLNEGISGSNFFLIDGSYTWEEARLDAESRGGQLAVLDTQDKINTANVYLQGQSYSSYGVYIGLSDHQNEGSWKWVDETDLSTANWASGEPNNFPHYGGEHFVIIDKSDWKWNDVIADGKFPYLLETYNGDINEGLVSYYDFSSLSAAQGSGNNISLYNDAEIYNDLERGSVLRIVTNSNQAGIYNNISQAPGGHALLDGALDDISNNGNNDFSISLWLKLENTQVHPGGSIINLGDNSSADEKALIGYTNQLSGQDNSIFTNPLYLQTPGDIDSNILANLSDIMNDWQHYAITVTGDTLRLYLNGEEVESYAGGNYWDSSLTVGEKLYFGAEIWTGSGGDRGSTRITARFDDLKVYNRAITSNEVTSLAN